VRSRPIGVCIVSMIWTPSSRAGFVLSENESELMVSHLRKSYALSKQPPTVSPKPPDVWSKGHRHALLGLFFVFSVAWALEQYVILFGSLAVHDPYPV
jgi:hypothetical protein